MPVFNDPPAPGVVTAPRRGAAIQTVSGHLFYPRDPREDDVHLPDFVHATSQMCRYNGHTQRFYSVLEHMVRACDLYGTCEEVAHGHRPRIVDDAVQAWVSAGCAPTLRPGDRVKTLQGETPFVVAHWDPLRAMLRTPGLATWINAEDVIPC